MTMQFSAYQIESMLDDYQQENFPSERSASENLSLSEEAINEAREHFTPPTKRTSIWKSPKEIIELIEDKNEYDPIVDFVQQSRAGRFVDPVYVPENSPPTFSLVTDYSMHSRKGSEEEQEILESEIEEKDQSHSKLLSGKARINDKVSVNESVSLFFLDLVKSITSSTNFSGMFSLTSALTLSVSLLFELFCSVSPSLGGILA